MKTIAVIGLGLIGGSILKGLKNKGYNVVGTSKNPETVKKALDQGLISGTSIDEADVIFICTPINITIDTIKEVAKTAKPEAIITDVASIKGFVMDFVEKNSLPINFIGGHPMAGTEHKGLDASFVTLFNDAKWVLTPSKQTSPKDVQTLEQIINELGAKVIIADPYEHDKAVALISHMPLFLSQALLSFVQNHNNSELALELAASGFRSMTRLAHTNQELAADILSGNKANVLETLEEFIKYLNMKGESLGTLS